MTLVAGEGGDLACGSRAVPRSQSAKSQLSTHWRFRTGSWHKLRSLWSQRVLHCEKSKPNGATSRVMMHALQGKTAVISAAGQGIGRAVAERFAAEGAVVFASDIRAQGLETLRAHGVRARELDSTDGGAVAAYVATFERVDILVNCVGYVAQGKITDCTADEWERSLRINVGSVFYATRLFLPLMRAQRSGSIVNISSVASSIKGFPDRAAYGTAKAAVIGLTKSVAADFVREGIRCNAVCPGTISSPSLQERIGALATRMGSIDAARAAFVERQPMGRLGTPEEVAALCLYLATDESAFVTGQTFVIDGGIDI